MNDFDRIRITKFIQERIQLKNFCDDYYRPTMERVTSTPRPDLSYDNLDGSVPMAKATYLVNHSHTTGNLAELVFYLIEYWCEEMHGAERIVYESEVYKDLCLAAQDLWRQDEADKARPMQAFDRLAKLYPAFDQEWRQARGKLAQATFREPNQGVDELIAYLKECRELYERAQRARESHHWIEVRAAILELSELQPAYGDTPTWRHRLENLESVRLLQRVIDAAEAGFLYDDRLPWEGTYPYRLFQIRGVLVTPRSAMDEIQAALVQPASQEAEQRGALEGLLQDDQRLFADAFFYPICPSRETAYRLETLFIDEGYDLLTCDGLEARFPGDEGEALLVLLHQSARVSARLEAQQRQRQRSGKLAHYQGLLALARCYDAEAQTLQVVMENWRQVISQWAVGLADETYWMDWGRARFQLYQRPFLITPIRNLRQRIADYLQQLLQGRHQRAVDDGQEAWAQAFDQLQQELFIELDAVRLAKYLEGITLGPGRIGWFGPLWMEHFGLQQVLADYLAAGTPGKQSMPDDQSPREALRRLRWYFSLLRWAAASLHVAPQQALHALDDARCAEAPNCNDLACLQHGKTTFPVPVCCAHWERFPGLNPAYSRFSRPQTQMGEDAVYLAIEAHLLLAWAQLDKSDIRDRDTLQAEWRAALELADCVHDRESVQERMRKPLVEEARLAMLSPDLVRLSSAIVLLEICLNTFEDRILRNQQAELLAYRGTRYYEQLNWTAAEEDLRRAVAVAPHLSPIREKLAVFWCNIAGIVPDRFRALDLLRQANELLQEGMEKFPDGYDYSHLLKFIPQTREALLGQARNPANGQDPFAALSSLLIGNSRELTESNRFYSLGIQRMREGRPKLALEQFGEALKGSPDDRNFQRVTAEAVIAEAVRLIQSGEHQAGLELIAEWMPRLPTQTKMATQLEFLKSLPRLQHLLNDIDMKFNVVNDYQELLLIFENSSLYGFPIHVRIEGEYTALSAPLPPFPHAQTETILGNWLLVSGEIALLRLYHYYESRLGLKTLIPLRLLDSQLLRQSVLWVFQCANLPEDKQTRLDVLRAWFQERRAAFVQRIGDKNKAQLSTSRDAIEAMCKERLLTFERQTEYRYQIAAPFGKIDIEMQPEGIRFATPLGMRSAGGNHLETLRRLVQFNTATTLGKLTIAEDQGIVLSVDFPYVDRQAAADTLAFLERDVPDLRSNLDKTI